MRRAQFLLVLVVLAAAGCGGSSSSGSSPRTESSAAAAPAGKSITIRETEFRLDPATVTLDKPGTVVFRAVNKGQVTHALEIEGHGVEAETPDIAPGETATLRVTLAEGGSYELYCPVDGHKKQGMVGKLTVGGAGAGTGDEDEGKTGTGGGSGY